MKMDYASTPSRFFCTNCGKESVPIMRRKSHMREAGHLKKLYCINCRKEINHFEVRDIDTDGIEQFKKEFILGRFIDGNRTEINKLMGCSYLECPYNQDGKCWNENNSAGCLYRKR